MHLGAEGRAAQREGDVGEEEFNVMAEEPGEELLKTF